MATLTGIKNQLGIQNLKLTPINGNADFLSYKDDEKKIYILIHTELAKKIQMNPNIDLLLKKINITEFCVSYRIFETSVKTKKKKVANTQLIPNVKKFIDNNGSFMFVIIIFLAFVPIIPIAIYKAIYESFFMLGVILLLLPFIYVICNLYDKLSYLRKRYREQREQVLSLYENIDTIEEWVKNMRKARYGDNLTAKFTLEDLSLFLHDPRRKPNRFNISISGKENNISEISEEKRKELMEEFNYLISSKFEWGVYEKRI